MPEKPILVCAYPLWLGSPARNCWHREITAGRACSVLRVSPGAWGVRESWTPETPLGPGIPGLIRSRANRKPVSIIQAVVNALLTKVIVLLPVAFSCVAAPRSSMMLEHRGSPLALVGPDAIALPVVDRYRYGVVLGSVMTSAGERGCNGDAWLQPWKAHVADVRPIAAARLFNMFRFPQLLPGRYVLGVRCLGFQPVHRRVEVRVGHVIRAVVTMRPQPLDRSNLPRKQ